MNKVLIINTRRIGDIYAMAPLLLGLKEKNPHCHITVFTYEESKKATLHMTCIDQAITFDRKHFLTLKKGEIYNKALSIDFLYKAISPMQETHWDLIINYSHDYFATYLSSFLTNTNQFCGLKYNANQSALASSSEWITILNEVSSGNFLSIMPNVEFFLQELKLKTDLAIENAFKTNRSLDLEALEAFKKIKGAENELGRTIQLIGIQFKTSKEDKDIPFNLLTETIENILDNPYFYPVILSSPDPSEKETINKLNSLFNNSLIIVESDLIGLPSILKNLDFLICPDTAIKHMADLIGTPTVEVSLGQSPLFKQGSRNNKSIIISDNIWKRSTDPKVFTKTSICAKDILNSIFYLNEKEEQYLKNISNEIHVISPIRTTLGTSYEILRGPKSCPQEMTFLITRNICLQIYSHATTQDIKTDAYNHQEIEFWIKSQIQDLSIVLKNILNLLRSLKTNDKNFIQNLDSVLAQQDKNMISYIPLNVFKFNLENMTNEGQSQNALKIETELFKLKNFIQLAVTKIKEIETQHRNNDRTYEEQRNN